MSSHRSPASGPRLGAVIAGALFALVAGRAEAVQFVDVAPQVGVVYQHAAAPVTDLQPPAAASQPTGGAAACDVDGDGWVDLVVSRLDATPLLFRNAGGTFADATASAGDLASSLPAGSNGIGCADLDNDGDRDLYVTSHGTTRFHLFLNDGSGRFTEDAVARGAALEDGYPHYGMGVAFGDHDRDGWLDVLTAEWWAHPLPPAPPLPGTSHNRLLRNLGSTAPAHFSDVTVAAGLDFESPPGLPTSALGTPGFSPGFVDFDGDRWPDVAWVADWGHSRLFWNGGDGTFTDGTVAAGVGRERSGMGSTQDDFDGDGRIDWFATSIFGRPDEIAIGVSNQMYRNRGDRAFDIVTEAAGVADGGFGWAASSFDFDNDGDADVAHTNGMFVPGHPEELRWQTDRTRLFENRGDGTFDEVAAARGIADAEQGKALLTLDFDRDGDLDVFVANHAGAPVLYRNDGGNAGSWLQLELEGTLSNRDGIGAVVTVTPDLDDPARRQTRHHLANSNFIAQDELLVHIGLGDHAGTIDRVTIAWPSGIVQTLSDVPVRARLRVTEAESGPPCHTAEISMLETRRHGGVFDKLRWTFRGTAGPSGDAFGAPGVATRYDLAVTDPQGTLVRVTVPASATLWRTTRTGYRFADRAASSGVARMVLERRAGTVAIAIAGKGRDLGLARRAPRLPLRVRLSNDAGSCWDVTYTDGRALGPGFRARLP